jgi:hypothetical protein
MPAAATFATRKRERGWEGQELEWNHQRGGGNNNNTKSVSAAVDLGQFQNTVVGQGYQAKHVIRQPGSRPSTTTKTTTTNATTTQQRDKNLAGSKSKSSSSSSSNNKSKNVEHEKVHDNEPSSSTSGTTSLQLLLQSSGLRQFRREIDSILNS